MSDRQQLVKIAKMAMFEVPQVQIARAVGLTEGRISQILITDDYRDVLAELSTDYFEQNQTLNDGWDTLEANSLKCLMDNLKWNNDPDFALRAAGVANKANRRGSAANRTIDGQAGARAIFHLTANFIEKCQQNFGTVVNANGETNGQLNLKKPNEEAPEQKDSDFMVPEKVEKLFIKKEPRVNDTLLGFFPDTLVQSPAE